MSNRSRRRRTGKDSRHRIIPVWNEVLDTEALAKTLLMLAMHLDETKQMNHTSDTDSADGSTQGGGSDE